MDHCETIDRCVYLEELDLPVRAFNLLRREGISTLQELFSRLDDGIPSLYQMRLMGRKTLFDILRLAKEWGYPGEKLIEEYLPVLRSEQDISPVIIAQWEGFLSEIRGTIPLAHRVHEGVILKSLHKMDPRVAEKLAKFGIVTVNELYAHFSRVRLKLTHGELTALTWALFENGYPVPIDAKSRNNLTGISDENEV